MTRNGIKPMTRKERLALVEKLEKDLSKVCQRLYEVAVGGRLLQPMHPYILVRVLPKEHKTEAGIWLADTAQNKPVYEGIVLATWQPWEEEATWVLEGKSRKVTKKHVCSVQVGDRVMFPHFEGLSMNEYLDDKYYRLIRESSNQYQLPYCSVAGRVSYKGDALVQFKVRELMKQLGSITTSGVNMSRGANPSEVTT